MTNSEQALTTQTETTTDPLAEAHAAIDRHTRRGLGQAAIFLGANPDLQVAVASVQVRADSPAAIDGLLAEGFAPRRYTQPEAASAGNLTRMFGPVCMYAPVDAALWRAEWDTAAEVRP
jgi:hypothetical protein